MHEMIVKEVAKADGRCFQCGQFVMGCGCWLKDLDFTIYNEVYNQPERVKRSDTEDWGNPTTP